MELQHGTDGDAETRCAEHPEREAPEVCERCGSFLCDECVGLVEGDRVRCRRCLVGTGGKKPWNPRTIAIVSFFTSFLGGGVLHTLNYARLGYSRNVRLRLSLWFLGYCAFATLMFFAPEGTERIGFAIGIAFAFFFASSQKKTFAAYERAGGPVASGWSAFGISLASTSATLIVLFGGLFAWEMLRWDEAHAALEQGDYEHARPIFEAECEAGEPGGCTNVGWIHEQEGDFVEARRWYERSCEDGDPVGCNNLGLLVGDGVGGDVDPRRARELLERSCSDGFGDACGNLALY